MTGLRSMLSNHSYHLVQDSVSPSKVQRGRVGMSGDGSSCRRSRRMRERDRLASGAGVRGLFSDVFKDLSDLM